MAKTRRGKTPNPALQARREERAKAERARLLVSLHDAYDKARAAEDWPAALAAIQRLRAELPHRPEIKLAEAKVLYDQFQVGEEAERLIREALDGLERKGDAYELLASIHLSRGRMDEAKAWVLKALDEDPSFGVANILLSKIDKKAAAEREPKIRAALERDDLEPLKRGFLNNALGRIREAEGDYDDAWRCFAAAKALAPCTRMDMDTSEATVQEGRAVFTPSFFAERRRWGSSDERMVFVVGLPRSGTTLIERILAAHPEVAAAGELHFVALENRRLAQRAAEVTQKRVGRYAHLLDLTPGAARKAAERYLVEAEKAAKAPDATRIVDKMPSNFAHLGLIAVLFPKARVIHVNREPLDVFLSSFKELFRFPQPHTYDPMSFAHYAILHQEIMGHWRSVIGERILDVRYEEIVADLEGEGRRMVAHLGLDWHEACAAPHLAEGAVLTASAAQVRQPVHKRSVGGWRRYEKQLAELKSILERYEAARAASEAA